MDQSRLEYVLNASRAAVQFAQDVRASHRKRTPKGANSRETDLQVALERLRRVMRPIRSELARMQHTVPQGDSSNQYRLLIDASAAIQRERRKLWKMQKRRKSHGVSRTGR